MDNRDLVSRDSIVRAGSTCRKRVDGVDGAGEACAWEGWGCLLVTELVAEKSRRTDDEDDGRTLGLGFGFSLFGGTAIKAAPAPEAVIILGLFRSRESCSSSMRYQIA